MDAVDLGKIVPRFEGLVERGSVDCLAVEVVDVGRPVGHEVLERDWCVVAQSNQQGCAVGVEPAEEVLEALPHWRVRRRRINRDDREAVVVVR